MRIKTFLALFLLCVITACVSHYPYKETRVSYMHHEYTLQMKNIREVMVMKHKDTYRVYIIDAFGDCYYIFNDSLHYYPSRPERMTQF